MSDKHRREGIVPVRCKIAGSADHHRDHDKDKGTNQAAKEDSAAQRRVQDNLATAGLLGRIWLLIHHASPEGFKI
jgi:hypothetical protein